MIFGNAVERPVSVDAAEWIAEARSGVWGTVGAFVPDQYPSMVRVRAPESDVEDWWAAYRGLLGVIADVGVRHTGTADRAWFAVWEGHGFTNRTTHIAMPGPLDDASRDALERERLRLRMDDVRRNAWIEAALREVPRFELPHRVYYLLTGPVSAVTELRDPGALNDWRRPDLFWPDDRRWFVATDVDFWALYVAGSDEFIAELTRSVTTPCELVTRDQQLERED